MNRLARRRGGGAQWARAVAFLLVLSGMGPTAGWPTTGARPSDRDGSGWPAEPPLGLDLYVPVPAGNPMSEAKVALGKELFLDPALSLDRRVACASCHRPARAFSDVRAVSNGVLGRRSLRNAPSLLNAAYSSSLFRDGRAPSLEDAVLQPVSNPLEMALPPDELVGRISSDAGYARRFEEVFGEGVSRTTVAAALASYVRSLRAANAPIDRYLAGDRQALRPDAAAGFRLFVGKASCVLCHPGPTFRDEGFHNTGVFVGSGDRGRASVTGRQEDVGAFRTPGLRNVELTAPYMHDGSLGTLREVVEFYDRGGVANPNLDPEIRPLGLSEVEKRQLVALLRALTGEGGWPE